MLNLLKVRHRWSLDVLRLVLLNVVLLHLDCPMASEFVDGMDILAVREAVERAVARGRETGDPTLLEIRTYRFMGHSMSDPGNYRTRAEIEKYQERDPIKLFTETLRENDILDDQGLEAIETRVRGEVEQAVKFAEESPLPDPAELYTDVLV